jgi:hypothetical protein
MHCGPPDTSDAKNCVRLDRQYVRGDTAPSQESRHRNGPPARLRVSVHLSSSHQLDAVKRNLLSHSQARLAHPTIPQNGSPTNGQSIPQRQCVSESVLYVRIIFQWEGAVMTGEDTDGEVATQCRCSVEACAGSPHEDQARPPDEQMPGSSRGSQSAKRDEEATPTNPNIVVAKQWLCFLLGLICMVWGFSVSV